MAATHVTTPRFIAAGLIVALVAAAPLRAEPQAATPNPGVQDMVETMLLLAPGPTATYIDFFPQDMNSYQTGGWRDTVNGDGSGGTVQASFDGASITLDGTINALAYAMRNAPVARDFEMSVDFAIVTQQMSPEDRLSFLLRFSDPVFPTACCFGGSGQVHAASGLRLEFNVGRGTVTPYRERNGAQGAALAPPTPFSIGFGQPHRMVISYRSGVLTVTQDGLPVGTWRTPNLAPGRVGLEAYRLDVTVSDLSLAVF